MGKSRTIRVTPNMKACLEILKEAVKSLPSGDLKKRADGAINYMSQTFEGKPQPKKGAWCPGGKLIIKA